MRNRTVILIFLVFLALLVIVLFLDDYYASPFGTVSEGQQLTEQQKAEVVRIAMSDPRVQAELRGNNYTMYDEGAFVDEWAGFKRAYPSVQFILREKGEWFAVIVDQRHGKVRELWFDVLPVVPANLSQT